MTARLARGQCFGKYVQNAGAFPATNRNATPIRTLRGMVPQKGLEPPTPSLRIVFISNINILERD